MLQCVLCVIRELMKELKFNCMKSVNLDKEPIDAYKLLIMSTKSIVLKHPSHYEFESKMWTLNKKLENDLAGLSTPPEYCFLIK